MPNEGKQNRANGKRFELALHAAIADASTQSGTDKWAALKDIATSLLNQAKEGNIMAIKEVRDTLDGKPAQAVNLGDHEGNALTIKLVQYSDK